jgi:hypothetical protein
MQQQPVEKNKTVPVKMGTIALTKDMSKAAKHLPNTSFESDNALLDVDVEFVDALKNIKFPDTTTNSTMPAMTSRIQINAYKYGNAR